MPVEFSALETGHVRVWCILLDHAAAARSVARLEKIGIPIAAIFMVFANEQGVVETTTAEHTDLTGNQSIKEGELMEEGAMPVAATIPGAFLLGPLVGVKMGATADAITEGVVGNLAAMGVPTDVAHQYARIIECGGVAIIADVPEHRERDVRQALETHEPMNTPPGPDCPATIRLPDEGRQGNDARRQQAFRASDGAARQSAL